ncbi:MAG TPA: ATP-binding protein [Archangium sp.]|uniref:sensor histidine kinase n=1 Tax=Archangium sp. TaxID=1872627 RepID=UPI002E380A97|nr:ATP-binding protein [Archangium sp.]HEX5747064.1 ATP-binding protein [Archangium sp.]
MDEPGTGPAPAASTAGGDRRSGDRRVGDRRRSDRRGTRAPLPDESWFGAVGVDGDRHADARESFFDPGWLAAGEEAADSHFITREARRVATAQDTALARVYRTYAAARAVVGLVLVAVQAASGLLGSRPALASALLCLAYAVQAITFWLLPRYQPLSAPQSKRSQRRLQWLATIGVDLVVFAGLHMLEPGSSFNFAALLVLPVLMAGVLTSRLLALATAAGVTLMLLFMAWRSAQLGGDLNPLMMQAGLAGLGLFVITLLSGELAGRLAREELAARGSLELARQQAQLNRLVIEEMVDGVLVVDHRLRVRAANPAARELLAEQGLAPTAPFPLPSRQAWLPLSQAVEAALADSRTWPEAGRDIALAFDSGHRRTLRVRIRFMRRRDIDQRAGEPFCVLLLEDVRTAEARLRQEKLAAMGRVSAGIAHEIRNPLAAISQANALLLEDELGATQQRLARIVADNVERLKRLVDDVMEVAPGAPPVVRVIDAAAAVAAAAAEWAHTVDLPLGADSRLHVDLPTQPLGVSFDPEHLRRVLVNLLDNAHRHASGVPGAIFLRLAAVDELRAQLTVASDSPPIPPEVERHLFEPFFSTRSRGTGLGLYICRELCERYGASIEYRARPGAARLRNEFRVLMQRAAPGPANATLGLVP